MGLLVTALFEIIFDLKIFTQNQKCICLSKKIDRVREMMWLNHYVTVQTIAQLNFEKERLDDFIESIEKKSKKSQNVTSFKNKDRTQPKANISDHPKTHEIDENT